MWFCAVVCERVRREGEGRASNWYYTWREFLAFGYLSVSSSDLMSIEFDEFGGAVFNSIRARALNRVVYRYVLMFIVFVRTSCYLHVQYRSYFNIFLFSLVRRERRLRRRCCDLSRYTLKILNLEKVKSRVAKSHNGASY